MCRFYTYKFLDCDHIYSSHVLRCRQAGADWTCNNNAVRQLERKLDGKSCNICRYPLRNFASPWLDVARNIIKLNGESGGGGTVNHKTCKDANTEIGERGFMCGGLIPTLSIGQTFFKDTNTTEKEKAELLCQYIARYVEFWACEFRKPMRYLGYWIEDGELYVDLSQRYLEPLKAVCMGLYRQEHAVFDLAGIHELKTGPLREVLHKHVNETVATAAKRDRAQERLASSDLATLRLKDRRETIVLDPKELYFEDTSVFDATVSATKSSGKKSRRRAETPIKLGFVPKLRAEADTLEDPVTPRMKITHATPGNSWNASYHVETSDHQGDGTTHNDDKSDDGDIPKPLRRSSRNHRDSVVGVADAPKKTPKSSPKKQSNGGSAVEETPSGPRRSPRNHSNGASDVEGTPAKLPKKSPKSSRKAVPDFKDTPSEEPRRSPRTPVKRVLNMELRSKALPAQPLRKKVKVQRRPG